MNDNDFIEVILALTRPGQAIHAILLCALDRPASDGVRLEGKAWVDQDGYVRCLRIEANGMRRPDALLVSFDSMRARVIALAQRAKLGDEDRALFLTKMQTWIETDLSGSAIFGPKAPRLRVVASR